MSTVQDFRTTDVLRLEIEDDPTGLQNLVVNSNGEQGGWGWITPVTGTFMSGDSIAGVPSLKFTTKAAVANYFATEAFPVTVGQYLAASWTNVDYANALWHRARFEFLNALGAVISSSAQSAYAQSTGGLPENAVTVQVPATTVRARLRFDVYSTNAGAAPTAVLPMGLKQVTVAQAVTIAELATVRTNLMPNPSIEVDTKGWESNLAFGYYAQSTFVRSTARAQSGAASLLVTWPNGTSVVNSAITGLAVGATYTLSAYVYVPAGSPDVRMTSIYYASGAFTKVKDAWVRISVTWTAQDSHAWVGVETFGAVAGQQIYVDAAQLEKAPAATPYFDSTLAASGGWIYGGGNAVTVTTRQNLLKYPAFRTALTGWEAGAPCVASWYNSASGGGGVARIGLLDGIAGKVLTLQTTAGGRVAVVPGRSYSIGGKFTMSAAWTKSTFQLWSVWYNAAGQPISSTAFGPSVTVADNPPNVWTRATSTAAIAPAGAASLMIYAQYTYQVGGNIPASTFGYLDDVIVTSDTNASYFDGSYGPITVEYTTETYKWDGAADASSSTATATRTVPYSTATRSELPYIPPISYLDILGPSHDVKITREELNVGTLTALVLDSSLDPAKSDLIRPGRVVRAMALDSTNNVWSQIFTGKILNGAATYDLKDPSTPDEKRTRITLTATDAATQLANAARAEGVGTIAELPYVLEGAGVPWSVNGSGAQVPTAVVVARNDQASVLDQVSVTRDSALGYAWVGRMGTLQVWDADKIDATVRAVMDETYYTALDIDFDMDRCINEVNITLNRFNLASGETVQVSYGPYVNQASIDKWGRHSAEFTVQGISETGAGAQIVAYANKILAANSTPQVRINSLQTAIKTSADFSTTARKAFLNLYDLVAVSNLRSEISEQYRVTSLEHTITPEKWTLAVGFATTGSVAAPQLTPAPSTGDAGVSDGTWIVATLLNGWTQSAPPNAVVAFMRKNGIVYLKGACSGGTRPDPIFQLPPGYRPAETNLFTTNNTQVTTGVASAGTAHTHNMASLSSRLAIGADGLVTPSTTTASSATSISGINFPAEI